jgi:AAA15 family ATPase/GTPase
MLTKIIIENFKKLDTAVLDLSPAVVFAGPNNCGKTSALQAISLWYVGMRRWYEHSRTSKAKERTGVTINRKELYAMPAPSALQLWYNLNVRKSKKNVVGKKGTDNIKIKITAEGYTKGQNWKLGFEFDYANPESIYCRILNDNEGEPSPFPEIVIEERLGFLPPMSGLSSEEDKLEQGSIQTRIGEGRTAEVLRNLCWNVFKQANGKWNKLKDVLREYFRVELDDPVFDEITGRLSITYREGASGKEMALSNSGRGFQQVLLIFSYLYGSDSTILLLDEPDAHLEVIRQKEIYNKLSETVKEQKSQMVIATHSESVLEEVAQKDTIIGFIGKPHSVNKTQQLVKSLNMYGFSQYLQAIEKKWVLYLEGSTDKSILEAFGRVLKHPALPFLEKAFFKSVDNNKPAGAESHFNALKEGFPGLLGCAVFDRLSETHQSSTGLVIMSWTKREIENYLPLPAVIYRFFEKEYSADLFSQGYDKIMKEIIEDYIPGVAKKDGKNEWWNDTKMSDDFLGKIFREFYKKINSPVLMDKSRYYKLAELARADELDPEIKAKLDSIYKIAQQVES